MIHTITVNDDGTTTLAVSFADEGVELEGTTHVKGGRDEAMSYLPTFERDLRRNYAELFPRPEPEDDPIDEEDEH